MSMQATPKLFDEPPALPAYPTVYPETARALSDLYLHSRAWSYYGANELRFAEDFARFHDAAYGVFMANGTVTLECALVALGIGAGDEVIVPAYTWMATAMAAVYVGAVPVFVDSLPDTFCMDPAAFEAAITSRTKAVIPVHLFGSMADIDAIGALARKHGISVIEDCAHAHGAAWEGKGAGSLGDIGSFSFQQSKIMTSGEGGLCTVNDPDLCEKLSRLKHIGNARGAIQHRPATPPPAGLLCHNYRATEFQAVILQGQLEHLAEETAVREKGAAFLQERFEAIPGLRVQARRPAMTRRSYYVFAVTVDPAALKTGVTRDDIIAALQAEGVPEVFPGWCDPVYSHRLWNIEPAAYRTEPCTVAEDLVRNRVILFALTWLMAPRSDQEKLCRAMEKVMREACA